MSKTRRTSGSSPLSLSIVHDFSYIFTETCKLFSFSSNYRVGVLAALLSAFLFWAAFSISALNWAIWICFLPLLAVCRRLKSRGAFLCGLLFGGISIQLVCIWIYNVDHFRIFHALPIMLYLGLYPAIWCLLAVYFRKWNLSYVVPGAAIWVLGDYLKHHAGFLSFPWASLAQSQHENLQLLQLCQYGGEYGITFLIIIFNLALAEFLFDSKRYRLVVITSVLVILLVTGSIHLRQSERTYTDQITVAAIQPSILPEERKSVAGRQFSYERLVKLTQEAADFEPDMLVLPETSLRNDDQGRYYLAQLKEVSRTAEADLVFGMSDYDKFAVPPSGSRQDGVHFEQKRYNAAYSFSASGALSSPYYKNVLVPFGEYNPLAGYLKLPEWFMTESAETKPGEKYQTLTIGGEVVVAPVICWEVMFSDFLGKRLPDVKPDLIVNLTNDNWFGVSDAARQQNTAGVLRAAEYHIPVVISSNTGPSQIIDSFGRVIAQSNTMFQVDFLYASLARGSHYPKSFYHRYGGSIRTVFIIVLVVSIVLQVSIIQLRQSNRNLREKNDPTKEVIL